MLLASHEAVVVPHSKVSPRASLRRGAWIRGAGFFIALLLIVPVARAEDEDSPEDPRVPAEQLPVLEEPSDPDYETPEAAEGFRTDVFGRDISVQPRDRRSISAWDIGGMGWYPAAESEHELPFAALYFWRRPDEQKFFRGTVSIFYNDLLYAHSLASSPFEVVFGFENETTLSETALWTDGERITHEELETGWVRGAAGLGYRRQIDSGWRFEFADRMDPKAPDNMFAMRATIEPKYLYFIDGHDTSPFFETPQDTFELQGRVALSLDAFERNLLDLLHRGWGVGVDGVMGWRANWEDWGFGEDADRKRDWRLLQAYAVVAGGIPALGERHRVISSLHGGLGGDLDRFSRPRLGGGPGGEEYLALARPRIPGTVLSEFTPAHYAVAVAEYRYELFFFTYVSARASTAWLERDRLRQGAVRREDDVMSSLGAQLTTGFLFETRLQVDYNYNFDAIRDGNRGGNEVVIHVSGSF